MISVITSVYRKNVFEAFRANVEQTIGVPCEFVAIDNSDGRMGLCEVYNKGAEQARYDLLCFAHEDILMRTGNWGAIVAGIFHERAALGLLGIAGGSYKPFIPSGWAFPQALPSTMFTSYIQSEPGPGGATYSASNNPAGEALSKVVSVDGMWFCTRRSVAREIRFDEALFRRFHCYDVDFSLAVYQQYDVAVTFDVLVEHFSGGSFNSEWVMETLKLHRKWKKTLPVNLAGLDLASQKQEEIGSLNFLLQKHAGHPFPLSALLPFIWSAKMLAITGFSTFIRLNLKLIKAWLRRLIK